MNMSVCTYASNHLLNYPAVYNVSFFLWFVERFVGRKKVDKGLTYTRKPYLCFDLLEIPA